VAYRLDYQLFAAIYLHKSSIFQFQMMPISTQMRTGHQRFLTPATAWRQPFGKGNLPKGAFSPAIQRALP
jgi:hypothetical protein